MIYSYRCGACKHEFEKMLSMARQQEPEGEACPNTECSLVGQVKSFISSGQTIAFMDPVRAGFQKPSGDWTNWLNNLKKKNKGCPDFNTFR